MKARIRPLIRPLVVLVGAAAFLGLFLNGYLSASAGGDPSVLPIVVAVAGLAAIAAGLIAAILFAQRQERRVRRVVQDDTEPTKAGVR